MLRTISRVVSPRVGTEREETTWHIGRRHGPDVVVNARALLWSVTFPGIGIDVQGVVFMRRVGVRRFALVLVVLRRPLAPQHGFESQSRRSPEWKLLLTVEVQTVPTSGTQRSSGVQVSRPERPRDAAAVAAVSVAGARAVSRSSIEVHEGVEHLLLPRAGHAAHPFVVVELLSKLRLESFLDYGSSALDGNHYDK